ncbi:MAG: hypothetical protein R2697_00170 [Ilumatobacteraceae bacterium]
MGLVGLSVVQGADEPLSRSDGLDAAFATTGPMRVLEGTLGAWRCEGVIDVDLPAGDMSLLRRLYPGDDHRRRPGRRGAD